MTIRLTIDLELADEGLGEVGGEAGGDACCGLQRGQECQVGHLHRTESLHESEPQSCARHSMRSTVQAQEEEA